MPTRTILIMRLHVGKDEREWVDQAWTWMHSEIAEGARVFMPAGNTPLALYRRCAVEPTAQLKSLRMMQLDEIISGPLKGTFRKFIETELTPYIEQVEWITGADQRADVAILGVGINGHVAFHEPFLPANFYGGCVRLSPEIQHYLELAEPTWGLTYGLGTFMRAEKILVLARGETKRRVLQRALSDESLPISHILKHRDVTLITDFDLPLRGQN